MNERRALAGINRSLGEEHVEKTPYQAKEMPIPESTLSKWSHLQAGTASKQAHVSIGEALDAYKWPSGVSYQVFLQGSW